MLTYLPRTRTRLSETFLEYLGRYEDSEVVIDFDAKEVYVQGRRVHLSPGKFLILAFLVSKPGTVRTSEELNRVLGTRYQKGGFFAIKRLRLLMGWQAEGPIKRHDHGWYYEPRSKEAA